MNREIVRMNLTGLEPAMLERIKAVAAATMRRFDGSPEAATGFLEAKELFEIIAELEAAR